MAKKKAGLIWMTFLGQTVYENLNPYWWFCEKMNRIPDQMIIFHAIENQSGISNTIKALSIISEKFENKPPVEISGISFDDEDAQGFYNKAEDQLVKAKSEKMQIFVDISPTTWSYVPVCLAKLAEQYADIVKSISYIQYTEHRSRKLPYPLIPYKGVIIHDFAIQQSQENQQKKQTNGKCKRVKKKLA